MCGIFGIVNQDRKAVSQDLIEAGTKLVAHRGPDGSGFFIDANIGLGHRRLSIIDLTDSGNQPMHGWDSIIIYNGEIYNYLEIKIELEKKGYNFKSQSDTEVVLAAYREWGENCVKRFNGMWAMVIYDKSKNILFCSRDRFGIKPFYFTQLNRQFSFASEIKQFSVLNNWTSKLNKVRCFEFLVYNYHDHTNETMIDGVYQLPKGHNLIYDLTTHTYIVDSYYSIVKSKVPYSTADVSLRFKALFKKAVKSRLRSDVKSGSALSGGLDSSSIVCMVEEINKEAHSEKTISSESVSACFGDEKYSEENFVDIVSTTTNTTIHKVYPNYEELIQKLDKIIWHQDEPFAGTSIYAQYAVFEKAREKGITVMLDGQGADEVLAGYEKFYLPFLKSLKDKSLIRSAKELKAIFSLHSFGWAQALSALNKFKKKAEFNKPDCLGSFWSVQQNDLFKRSEDKTIFETSINLLYEMGISVLLHYEDRNSMAHSVESRIPFLDYKLVEFILSLPDEMKIKNGKRKFILREAMKDLIPEEIYNRFDKMGFVTPQEKWMSANKLFFDNELTSIISQYPKLFKFELLNSDDWELKWRVFVFGKWLRIFNIQVD